MAKPSGMVYIEVADKDATDVLVGEPAIFLFATFYGLNLSRARRPIPSTAKHWPNLGVNRMPRAFVTHTMLSKHDLSGEIIEHKDRDASTRPSIITITSRNQRVTAQLDALDGLIEQGLVEANHVRQRWHHL